MKQLLMTENTWCTRSTPALAASLGRECILLDYQDWKRCRKGSTRNSSSSAIQSAYPPAWHHLLHHCRIANDCSMLPL